MTKSSVLGYAYLASPYRGPPELIQHRYLEAQRATRWLVYQGFVIYSPIVHWHSIAERFPMTDETYWIEQDRVMLRDAKEGLIVLQLPGWRKSEGVNMEIDWALQAAQPIRELVKTSNMHTGEQGYLLLSVLGDPRT